MFSLTALNSILYNRKLAVFIILCICLIVYIPIYSLDFQDSWDDQWVVINEYTENGLSLPNLKHILFDFYHGQYSPVNQLFYSTMYALNGYDPLLFHFCCLLVHLCNTVLVYLFIDKLLKACGHDDSLCAKTSFLTTLMFSIHPIVVEPVSWISASKILIYSLFYLVALIAYIDYMSTKKLKYYLLAMVCFVLSFGAKEQAVVLPVAFFLTDYLVKGKQYALSGKVLLEKVPFLALALFFGLLTIYSQAYFGAGLLIDQKGYPLVQRLIFASYALTEYFTKIIFPLRIHHLYPFPNDPGHPVPIRFYVYPVALIIIVIYLIRNFTVNYIYFGICFFVLHLITCIHLIPMARVAIVADRYAYVSAIGILFPISYYLAKFKQRAIAVRIVVLYCLFLSVYSYTRTSDWRNSTVLKNSINS
ncbi:hypothetical protein [Chitinophaga ginsengisoli]|uniref:Dolichyl-phosphate-mannose-protein mannosyltransferase n=1 Tax=Chitinophaga ginsengisoli TaxID=363837 RepID=A0A2P8FRU0_9BACT|nr:hypothetical protein [Chitinophaga ginsengisoli]PSL24448.1 hypothetical protein CLV42_11535 [Chitinophaga ginsengisoli]